MSRASVYVFASLISGVSAALILTSNPSYTHAHNAKQEQSVYNDCRTSSCQIAYLNSLEDFCLWAPSQPELDLSVTRNTEHTLTAWCTKSTHGTRLISDGTISWAHFVKTPEFIQITGIGNLTNINVPADGVASANGEGNHVPGLVFTSAYGQPGQIYEWMSFVSREKFCFRACNPSKIACPQIYDAVGCSEIVSGNHDSGWFKDCIDNIEETPTLVASSHYSAYPPSCTGRRTIGNGRAARRAISSTSGSSTPLASSTTTSMEAATTITFPSFPTPTSSATTLMNSTTSTSTGSFNHTAGHTHRHTHSHHHFTTSSTSTSISSSHRHWHSSSNRSSASDPPPMSAALSLTSLTSITSTYSSSDPPSVTSMSSVTSTSTDPPSNPTPIPSSSSSSSHGTSSPSSSTPSATPSSTSPTPSSPPSTTHSTSSTTSPPTSSTSSHSSVPTFATPSSPSETTDGFSSTFQNTATQLSSQCAPVQLDVVDAGFITPPPSLMICMILTIILSTFIGVLSI